MKKTLKTHALNLLIVAITLLSVAQACHGRLTTTPAASTDASAQYITVSGMKYLIVSTPQGLTLANVTKDSLEVILRKRNELYLELANRQHKKTTPK